MYHAKKYASWEFCRLDVYPPGRDLDECNRAAASRSERIPFWSREIADETALAALAGPMDRIEHLPGRHRRQLPDDLNDVLQAQNSGSRHFTRSRQESSVRRLASRSVIFTFCK